MDSKPFWASKTIGGSFAIILGLVLPMLGVTASPTEVAHWTDSLMNAADAIVTAGGILMTIYGRFAAKKPVTLTGAKIAAAIALLVGSLALFDGGTSLARAADLPAKAAPPAEQAFLNGSGWYLGVGTEAGLASSSVSGSSFPALTAGNLTASGAAVGIDVGYIRSACFVSTWCQVELGVRYQNINGGLPTGGSVASQWAISEEFDVGADLLQNIFSTFGTNFGLNFPTFNPTTLLPAALKVATTPRQYFGFVAEEDLVGGSVGSAQGQTWQVPIGLKTGWRWQVLSSSGAPTDSSLNIYGKILWATQGVDLTGVFAAPGGVPLEVHSSAGMNTLYAVGMHLDFGI